MNADPGTLTISILNLFFVNLSKINVLLNKFFNQLYLNYIKIFILNKHWKSAFQEIKKSKVKYRFLLQDYV